MFLRFFVGFLLFLIIAPILVIIPISFSTESIVQFPSKGFTFKWYQELFSDAQWTSGIIKSLIVAIYNSVLSLIIGTMAAVAVAKVKFPGKNLFMNLMIAPISIPVIVIGIAVYRSFSTFNLTDTVLGLVLTHTLISIPLVFVTVLASLRGVDPSLDWAAQGMGSTPIGSFFKVTVPLIGPALFAGWLFAFITSLDELVMTIFVSGPNTKTLPIVMWEHIRYQINPTFAAASTILIVLIVAVFIAFPRLIQIGPRSR